MIAVRGGSGLGDALYLRAAVEILLRQGERVTVCNDWPDVFLGLDVRIEPFRRTKIDRLAHYSLRKGEQKTSQWEDVCIQAGIVPEPMRIAWTQQNPALVQEIRRLACGRPVVLVHGGITPMGRTDGFGAELLPLKRGLDCVLREFGDCYTVRVGKGASSYPLNVSLDLTDMTTIPDLLDLAQDCDGIVGQCSYAVPLAEAFDKAAMFVWSAKGLNAPKPYVRQITPAKILSKESSMFIVDNWTEEQIRDEVRAFRFLR